jgi:putative molybdopterin biosynthesis protein
VLVHGVAIKPAKPTILGLIGSVPVIGVPGYPVSANLAVRLFLEPLLYWLQGQTPPEPAAVPARLTRRLVSPLGAEEFVRVKVARVGREIVATPLSRGAGIIMSVVRSDGFVRIPAQSEGLPEDSEVTVWLDSPDTNLNRTIMAIGSHDVALDILADLLKARYPEWALSSAHVGSQGGLLALKRGEAHLAGIHLLDPATGDYNKGYLKQYLPGRDIVLLNLIYRVQGLMVRQGNPKGIKDLRDLARNDVVFVNRQRGAGTRVLLDYELQRLNLTPAQITGYSHEEYTHLGVAASVAGGTADVGLGIATAARSFGLDFIPVTAERYDLAIPREYYNSPMIQALVEVIRSQQFEAAVTALGGYDTRLTGQEM